MTIFFIRYFYHKNEGTLFHIDFKNGELHPTARQIAKYKGPGPGLGVLETVVRVWVVWVWAGIRLGLG